MDGEVDPQRQRDQHETKGKREGKFALARLERDGGGALTVSPPSSYRIGPGVMGAMLRQPNFSQDFRAQLHKCLGLEVTPRLVALLESHYGTGIGQALARDQDAADATP